jgi:putative hydrolase of the HAD superfamily
MSEIRAVIFDCYSTLIDIKTDEEKKEVFHYLSLYLQYYGAKMNAESLQAAFKLARERYPYPKEEHYPEIDLEVVFRNVLNKYGLDNPFLAESCCKLFRVLSREHFQLFPDSLPVLEEMRQKGYQLGIISDAQKVFCFDEGEMLGLSPFFGCFVVSTHFGFRKPDPRLFMVACTLLNIPPVEAVYIGNDPETDVGGAKGVGMQAILLDRKGENTNSEPKPDFYANSLWDAWDWIKGLR